MNEFFRKISVQIKEFFLSLSGTKKAAMIFTLAAVITSFVALAYWAGDKSYEPLGKNYTAEDATAIMRYLRSKKIPFRVADDGRTVKVPPEVVYDLRLELATVGLPQSSVVGYEVFDEQSFGTTSFVQRINKKRALEGELTRTINNIKGVRRSRVHLALPEKAAFIEDQKSPKASVVIDLEPGIDLSEKQTMGVVRLISSAIEGMDLGDVTIVDGNGKLLSKNVNDPLAFQIATMTDFERKLETQMENQVTSILEKIVGDGKVVAKVSLDLDFTQTTETARQYDAEGSAVRSSQQETHSMDGQRPVARGAPGAVANTPGPAAVAPAITSNTQKNYDTKNFAVPEKTTFSKKQVGTIKKVNVAVLVDGFYTTPEAKEGEDPASVKPVFNKWSPEKLEEFKALVSSAVGINLARGDTIKVSNMEFHREQLKDADEQIAAFERRRMISHLIQYAVIGMLIVLFFFFVVRPFVKWLTDNTVENMESFLPKTIEELEQVQQAEPELEPLEETIPVIVDKVDPEKVEGEMIKEKVVTLVESNPQKAAMILHDWVHEPPKVKEEVAGA